MRDLNIKTYGSPGAPAVLLMHGLFGASTNWGSVARRLADDYHVIVPDLRNHGQSPHVPDNSYAAMAGDVLDLMDAHDLASASLIGHSMGGKVAMHLALNRPERVARLAVVDIAPVDYGHNFDQVFARIRAVSLTTLQGRSDADRQMDDGALGSGVRAFLLQNLVRGPDGWAWRLNIEALERAQAEITGFPSQAADARFDGAAHFIHGALSDYVKPEHEATIRAWFPNARFCEVADAGHWVYADRPQGFAACLDAFLANGRADSRR